MRQVDVTWKLAFQASCDTCPHLVGEDMKLGLQAIINTWHSPNGDDPLHSWLATYHAPIEKFCRSLLDKSSFSL